jgi:hypothetical protein
MWVDLALSYYGTRTLTKKRIKDYITTVTPYGVTPEEYNEQIRYVIAYWVVDKHDRKTIRLELDDRDGSPEIWLTAEREETDQEYNLRVAREKSREERDRLTYEELKKRFG